MPHLYGGTILKVDVTSGSIARQTTADYARLFLGGRGVNIKLLYDILTPRTPALDPSAPLILGGGPLCGRPVPSGRAEVSVSRNRLSRHLQLRWVL